MKKKISVISQFYIQREYPPEMTFSDSENLENWSPFSKKILKGVLQAGAKM